jgi:hypothetical protein
MPAISTSLFLVAIGAILRYAVTATVSGIALPTVGLILMIVGAVGLALSVVFTFLPWRRSAPGVAESLPPDSAVQNRPPQR